MAQVQGKAAARSAAEELLRERSDVVKESVAFMARELVAAEVSALVGAELSERSEGRVTHPTVIAIGRGTRVRGAIDVDRVLVRVGS